tara:strand:+ start:375 stop:959 length:585 start_codon:yes stop_codon:yes gene_type:complete
MKERLPQNLELADGTLIDPLSGSPVVEEDDSSPLDLFDFGKELSVPIKRTDELPVEASQMPAYATILAYTLLGVTDADIGRTLKIDYDKIIAIKESGQYTELQVMLMSAVAIVGQNDVRGIFDKYAKNAAAELISQMNSKNEVARSMAAKDVLDRAGHRPADIVEHKHKVEGGLTIEYIKKDSIEPVTIDMETL